MCVSLPLHLLPPPLISALAVMGHSRLATISRTCCDISLFFCLRISFRATDVCLLSSHPGTVRKSREINAPWVSPQTTGDGSPRIKSAPASVLQIEKSKRHCVCFFQDLEKQSSLSTVVHLTGYSFPISLLGCSTFFLGITCMHARLHRRLCSCRNPNKYMERPIQT